jgi:hypothetical protein
MEKRIISEKHKRLLKKFEKKRFEYLSVLGGISEQETKNLI